MNVMEFINDDNDTLYITINGQAVMGGVNVGDEVTIENEDLCLKKDKSSLKCDVILCSL